MNKTINLYKQLILAKISPEALPYSRSLLWGLILSYFLINVGIFLSAEKFSAWQVLVGHAAYIGLGILFIYILLIMRKMEIRLHKILLALFGVDLFFLALSFLISPLALGLQLMIAIVFMIWSLAIKTHIFSKGLDLKTFQAIFVVISFEIVRHIPIALLILNTMPVAFNQ